MIKEKLSFSAAHNAVLSGHKIAREGWNGKGIIKLYFFIEKC